MSGFISIIIAGLIFTNPNYSAENIAVFNTPQIVVSNPQATLQGDETEKFEQTYPLNQNGRISVDNVNGSIVIEAWDKNEVKLEALKISNSRERLAEIQIKVDSKPDSLRVETEYNNWKNGNRNWNCNGYCRLEVQYKLMVPRGANLNEIETVNGSVTISNMTNFTKASAVNGSVKATDLSGTAEIETVNGTSEVSFTKLDGNSKINLSTVNGRVNLIIPSDTDATIKAETVNGSINNEFNLPVRKGKYVGRDLYGKLGDGSVKIKLDSVNGGLNIKRQQDGKNVKSAVNLLNMNADNEDAVDDIDVKAISKINSSVAKAVQANTKVAVAESLKIAAQSQAIAEKALRESAREMAQNQREGQRNSERFQREAVKMGQEFAKMYSQEFGSNWVNFASNRIDVKSESFPVKGSPKVTIDAKSCSVSVRGWDQDEVKYRVTKVVRGIVKPDVNITVNHSDSEVIINAAVDSKTSGKNGTRNSTNDESNPMWIPENAVRIEVFVPKKSNLRILTDREIRVDGIKGNIDLSGNDGAINVRDSEGKLKIIAADALVRVIGFNGEVDSKTSEGINYFEGDFVRFVAKTGDGKIILTLPENTNLDLQSDSEIQTEGFNITQTENENIHRIGKGGKVFQLISEDGEILVRNAKLISAKY